MSAAETPSADPMDLAVRAALRGVRAVSYTHQPAHET